MFSKTLTKLSLACLIVAPFVAGNARASDDPPQGLIDEGWFVLKLQGRKCGHMHATTTRVGDEILTRVAMAVEITRGSNRLAVTQEQNSRESVSGEPLAFQNSTSMGTIPVKRSGTIADGRLRLETEQAGAKRVEVYDFDPEIRFAWGQLLLQRKHGREPGTSYRIKIYEPDLRVSGPVAARITIGGKETVDVLGKRRELTRVTMTMDLDMPLVTESWVDDDFNPIVMTFSFGIIEFKVYHATQEEALGETEAPEMFFQTFVPVKRRIDTSAGLVKLRLRLPPDCKDKLPKIPDTSMQTFERINDREAVLTIRREDWKALANAGDDPPPADMAPYLRASTILDIDNRRIKRLARRAVRHADTPAERADALRKYVTDYINDKSLDIGFATASEVAQTREGDCTEHAVLLAALARAAGLPARGVSGIIQVPAGPLAPSKGSAFGYHMWTQIYIGGRWVDIDAAMRQTDCDPTHIALALSPLNEEGMIESVMAMIPLLGKLQIEVIDVEQK